MNMWMLYTAFTASNIIYIYMCVCVCVCVCADREGLNSVGQMVWRMKKHDIKWSKEGISYMRLNKRKVNLTAF